MDVRGFAYVSLGGREVVYDEPTCTRMSWKTSPEGILFRTFNRDGSGLMTLIPWARIIHVQTKA